MQVVYGIAAEFEEEDNDSMTLRLLRTYASSISELTVEWRTSLSSLPGGGCVGGGQKEILPGDELVLLISQYLQFLGPSQTRQQQPDPSSSGPTWRIPSILQATGLLEEAMARSPHNPHLKIAAIVICSLLCHILILMCIMALSFGVGNDRGCSGQLSMGSSILCFLLALSSRESVPPLLPAWV